MKISFIIPTHNNAEYIHAAVESCLAQIKGHDSAGRPIPFEDMEIVIVDDCSTDSTPDYISWAKSQEWASKCVFIRNEKNLGRSASRNIGNRAASGEILAVLDADDLNAPKRAELTVAKFKAGSVFVHGAAHKTDAVGRDKGMVETDVFNLDKAVANLSAGIVHSTVAYSKDLALKYPYLEGDPARLGVDDFTVFMMMAFDGVKFDYIASPLAAYRLNEFGITNKRDDEEAQNFKKGFVDGLRKVAA